MRAQDRMLAEQDVAILKTQGDLQVALNTSVAVARAGTSADARLFDWKTTTDSSESELSMVASQLVWDGGKVQYQLDAARAVFLQSNDTYDHYSIEIRYGLRTQFLSVWAAQMLLKLNQKILKRRETQCKQVEYRYKAGLENLGALAIAKANLGDAQFQVSDAQRAIKKKRILLEKMLGCPVPTMAVTLNSTVETIDVDQIPTLALQHPASSQVAHQIKTAESQLAYQQSLYMPDVYFNIQADKTLANPFHNNPSNTDQWGATVVGTWQLWDSGQRHASIEKATIQLAQLRLRYDDTLAQLKANLHAAFLDYESSCDDLENQKSILLAIEERAKIMATQYDSGLITFNDWSLIEDKRVSAEKAVLQAHQNYYVAIDAWIMARGGQLNE